MKLRFKLNHYYQGQNSPFLYAADAGLFAQAGIDITFIEGFSSSQVTRALLEDEADLGFGDVTSVLEHAIRSGTAPIAALLPIYVRSPCAIAYQRRETPLQLHDLDGAGLCGPQGDTSARLLPLLLARNGLAGMRYDMQIVSPAERDQLMADHAVLGATCFDATIKFAMPMRGHDSSGLQFLYFADHGLDIYSSAVIAKRSLLDAHPGLAKTLGQIIRQAWDDCQTDPGRGIVAVLARQPDADPLITGAQLEWVLTHQVYHPSQPPFVFDRSSTRWADTISVAEYAATGAMAPTAQTISLAEATAATEPS